MRLGSSIYFNKINYYIFSHTNLISLLLDLLFISTRGLHRPNDSFLRLSARLRQSSSILVVCTTTWSSRVVCCTSGSSVVCTSRLVYSSRVVCACYFLIVFTPAAWLTSARRGQTTWQPVPAEAILCTPALCGFAKKVLVRKVNIFSF